MAKMKAFNTGKFAEKVSALATYDGTLITDLYMSPENKNKINRGAAFVIKNYFDNYLDMQARQNNNAYHHVYEFNMTGQKTARLFKGNISSTIDGAVISYTFVTAKNPNNQGYPFPNKAEVMEKGDPLVIQPKRGKYLKYTLDDGRFVTTTKSIVNSPGGSEVKGSFESTFNKVVATQGSQILNKFGFFRKIDRGIQEKRRLIVPRINSGIVTNMISNAKRDANLIADGVTVNYV
jgi:hypothetical protein